MIAQRILALALLCCVLVGCGGGGGNNDGTANQPPQVIDPPPDPDQVRAENARVRMILNGTLLAIEWLDLFDNESGFQVERRIGAGSWEIVETLPAINGRAGYWDRSVPVAASYRLTVLLPGKTIPLHSLGHETEIAIDPAPSNPATIQIDQTEPVRSAVQVSLQNAGPAIGVTYTIDGAAFAHVTSGGTFVATLPAAHLVDGRRELYAFIEKSSGLTVAYKRWLQVDNPAPAVLLTFNSTYPRTVLTLTATASSDAGIASVEFFLNGASLHVASAPVPATDRYVYSLEYSMLRRGTNAFRVVATDSASATVAMDRTYVDEQTPTLIVTGLFDRVIASSNDVMVTGESGDSAPVHVWSVVDGENALPDAASQADGHAYFLTTDSGTLYRVSLSQGRP